MTPGTPNNDAEVIEHLQREYANVAADLAAAKRRIAEQEAELERLTAELAVARASTGAADGRITRGGAPPR